MELTKEFIEQVRKEIDKYPFYLGSQIPLESVESIRATIVNNPFLMQLYGDSNPFDIAKRYVERINKLQTLLYDEDLDQYLANCLEYLRFTCMQENIEDIPGVIFFDSVSNSNLSGLLIGKSGITGQAVLFSDLVSNKIDLDLSIVNFYRFPDVFNIYYAYHCLLIDTEEGQKFINPATYNGNFRLEENVSARNYNMMIPPYDIERQKVKKARAKTSQYLIDTLGINELTSSLIKDDMSDATKNDIFIRYINDNKEKYDVPTRFDVIMINGVMLDVSRLLELFYISSGMQYGIVGIGKENSTFVVDLDGDFVELSLKNREPERILKPIKKMFS